MNIIFRKLYIDCYTEQNKLEYSYYFDFIGNDELGYALIKLIDLMDENHYKEIRIVKQTQATEILNLADLFEEMHNK